MNIQRKDAVPYFAVVDEDRLILLDAFTEDPRKLGKIFSSKDADMDYLEEVCPQFFELEGTDLELPLTIVYVSPEGRTFKPKTVTTVKDVSLVTKRQPRKRTKKTTEITEPGSDVKVSIVVEPTEPNFDPPTEEVVPTAPVTADDAALETVDLSGIS